MATNRIIPLAREVEVGKRITGNADRRPRPKVDTAVQVERLGGTMERSFRNILDRDDIMSCPLLSGPSTMTVWIKEGTTHACQEAQA